MSFDMHFHTQLSDWVNSSMEVVNYAKENWLTYLACTDHDTINREIKDLCLNNWIDSSLWVEISARNKKTKHSVHITCYAENFTDDVDNIVSQWKISRNNRVFEQINLLKSYWFNLDWNEFYKQYLEWQDWKVVTNWHLWAYILSKPWNIDLVKSISWWNDEKIKQSFIVEFLKEWWAYCNYGFIDKWDEELSIEVCWEIAKANKAILSIAHPHFSFKWDIEKFRLDFPMYYDVWLKWVEINTFTPIEWINEIYSLRKKFSDLFITFWSDCHKIWKYWKRHWSIWELNTLIDSKTQLWELKKVLDFIRS